MIFNIEADPREMRNVAIENTWVVRPMSRVIGQYMARLKEHPNPPAAKMTIFEYNLAWIGSPGNDVPIDDCQFFTSLFLVKG